MKSWQSTLNSKGKLWLNVASGPYVLEDFINLDNSLYFKLALIGRPVLWLLSSGKRTIVRQFVDARKQAVLVRINCKKRLPFENQSVNHVLCSHYLEHLYPNDALNVLREFFRILVPSGTVHIVVPDLNREAQRYLNSSEPLAADRFIEDILSYGKSGLSFLHRLLDFSGNYGLKHLWMYDRSSMADRLSRVGFRVAEKNSTPSADFRRDDGSLHIVAIKC